MKTKKNRRTKLKDKETKKEKEDDGVSYSDNMAAWIEREVGEGKGR